MARPPQASNQKLARLPVRSPELAVAKRLLSILFAGMIAPASTASTEKEPLGDEQHEREELGVNSYTACRSSGFFSSLMSSNRCPLTNSNVISLHQFSLAANKGG